MNARSLSVAADRDAGEVAPPSHTYDPHALPVRGLLRRKANAAAVIGGDAGSTATETNMHSSSSNNNNNNNNNIHSSNPKRRRVRFVGLGQPGDHFAAMSRADRLLLQTDALAGMTSPKRRSGSDNDTGDSSGDRNVRSANAQGGLMIAPGESTLGPEGENERGFEGSDDSDDTDDDQHVSESASGERTHTSDTATTASSEEELRVLQEAAAIADASYRLSPWTLRFCDAALEARYAAFYRSHAGFAAGKLALLVANAVAVLAMFPFLGFSAAAADWRQPAVLACLAAAAAGVLALALLFRPALEPQRERIFVAAIAVHWPAHAAAALLAKRDGAYRYAYVCCATLFCCFVAQPRFVAIAPVMTALPLAACAAITFGSGDDYWARHSYFEMLYWLFPLFPLLMLRIFERYNRDAFVVTTRNWASVAALEGHERVSRRMIARFFPPTVARRVLLAGGAELCAVYQRTALMLTHVQGFGEWAAQASAEMVVTKLAAMFRELERLARKYAIERVTVDGDRYLAALFPPTARRQKKLSMLDDNDDAASVSSRLTGLSAASSGRESLTSHALRFGVVFDDDDMGITTNRVSSTGEVDSAEPSVMAEYDTAARPPRQELAVDAGTAERCHSALRFATAVRCSRDAMGACVAVHVGDVAAGVLGTAPPKVEVFGTALVRLELLAERGKRRHVHASEEAVAAARGLGRPSDDFEPSDANGFLFSRWRAVDAAAAIATDAVAPTLKAVAATTEPFALTIASADVPHAPASDQHQQSRRAIAVRSRRELAAQIAGNVGTLSELVRRSCDAQRAVALEGFDVRESLLLVLRRRLFDAEEAARAGTANGNANGEHHDDVSPTSTPSGPLSSEELRLLEELDAFERNSHGSAHLSSESSDHGHDTAHADEPGDDEVDDDRLQTLAAAGDEAHVYTVDWWRMRFADKKIEAQFRQRIRKSGMTREVFSGFALMAMFLLLCHSAAGCGVRPRARLLVSAVTGCVMLHMAFLHHTTRTRAVDTLVNVGVYGVVAWAAALMYDPSGCEGGTAIEGLPDEAGFGGGDAAAIGGDVVALYFLVWAAAPSFSLDLWMPLRFAALAAILAQFPLAVAARRALYGEGDRVLVYEWFPLRAALTLPLVSLFAELAMRHAFQSTMRVRSRQAGSAARSATTNTALELLLPPFAVKRVSKTMEKVSTKANAVGAVTTRNNNVVIAIDSTTETTSDSESTDSRFTGMTRLTSASKKAEEDSVDPLNVVKRDLVRALALRTTNAVWPMPRAVVMFVSFTPPLFAFDVISDTVARVEAVAAAHGLQKVQTAGTVVKLIGGVARGEAFEDAVARAAEAALEIQRRVFPPRLTEGWRHGVAIHCGPVFCAMIGAQALSFGVYGDTVNVARCVLEAAPSEAVFCTAAVCQAVPRDDTRRAFHVAPVNSPVAVRGRGEVAVFRVLERGRWGPSAPGLDPQFATDDSPSFTPSPHAEHQVEPEYQARFDEALREPGFVQQPDGQKQAPDPGPLRQGVDADEELQERAPSEYAESIRSSLRSASMLPSAALPIAAEFDAATFAAAGFNFDHDSDLTTSTVAAPSGRATTLEGDSFTASFDAKRNVPDEITH